LAVVLAAGVAVAQQPTQDKTQSPMEPAQQQPTQQPAPQPEQVDRANKQAPRVVDPPNTAGAQQSPQQPSQQQTQQQQPAQQQTQQQPAQQQTQQQPAQQQTQQQPAQQQTQQQTQQPQAQQQSGNEKLAPEQQATQQGASGTAPSRPTGTQTDIQGGAGYPKPSQVVGPPNAQEPTRGAGMQVPGASSQTIPAKFSEAKADLAEGTIMGYPLQLNDQQRSAIWKALAERDTTDSARGKTIHEEPGVFLPPLVQGQEFPSGLTSEIPLLQGKKYVKTESKILIVQPANGIIRGVIQK
jgi:hypothetical protein